MIFSIGRDRLAPAEARERENRPRELFPRPQNLQNSDYFPRGIITQVTGPQVILSGNPE